MIICVNIHFFKGKSVKIVNVITSVPYFLGARYLEIIVNLSQTKWYKELKTCSVFVFLGEIYQKKYIKTRKYSIE